MNAARLLRQGRYEADRSIVLDRDTISQPTSNVRPEICSQVYANAGV